MSHTRGSANRTRAIRQDNAAFADLTVLHDQSVPQFRVRTQTPGIVQERSPFGRPDGS